MDFAHADPRADSRLPRLGIGRAVAIAFFYFVVQSSIGALAGIPVGFYAGVTGQASDPEALQRLLGMVTPTIGILGAVTGGGVALYLIREALPGALRDGALSSVGWVRAAPHSLLVGFAIGCAVAAFYIFALVPLGPAQDGQGGPLSQAATAEGYPQYSWAVFVMLFAPPVEELIFRGALLTGFRERYGTVVAGVVVSLVFVAAHVAEALAYWPAWIALSLAALILLGLRLWSGSLLPAVVAHFAYNGSIVLAVFAGIE